MSGFTESSDNDTPALTYYVQAINAFEQGNAEYAEVLCQKAAKLYERAGNDEVSAVYIQLGLIETGEEILTRPRSGIGKHLKLRKEMVMNTARREPTTI
jgi:hypothetical protein